MVNNSKNAQGDAAWLDWIGRETNTSDLVRGQRIQSLWSGYGEIVRCHGQATEGPLSLIVKRVNPPSQASHPRGWNSDHGHERKLRSYDIELHFYAQYASQCDPRCRVPRLLAGQRDRAQWTFVLEDLDAAGFAGRRQHLPDPSMVATLSWLAHFHATFLGQTADGLWPIGTYWHLDTRPDELNAMRDRALRQAAPAIDAKLNAARFQTLVHGDAKVANFCYTADGARVAAVDFQYVGGGAGIKDVAYFLGSVLDGEALERRGDHWLDVYFDLLREALSERHPNVDFTALEEEWRMLYGWAWADFERFLDGWAPGHWKRSPYAQRLTQSVLSDIR